jgi:5-(carboxyamino)imidazole ribonucleotide synthase
MTSPQAGPQAGGLLAKPGDAIGVLGGGQLGRMLAMAAARLGFDVHVYTPDNDSPASRVARKTFVAKWDDAGALREFAASIKVATIEFENIPTASVDVITRAGVMVRPDVDALATAQDRLAEKTFLRSIGIATPDFVRIDGADQIGPALKQVGGAGILKTRFLGYDGKGQVRLTGQETPALAWAEVGAQRSILEGLVTFEREISVICCRTADGAFAAYDPPENDHAGGVLRKSTFPAKAPPELIDRAIASAKLLADALEYVGVLCLELFVTADGQLLANEFAPRVHNSGHWTEDACTTSQFEQHIRAVCGWPLGDTYRHADGEMLNLLGEDWRTWDAHIAKGAKVHLYGKRRAADGRKMGHVTYLKPRSTSGP